MRTSIFAAVFAALVFGLGVAFFGCSTLRSAQCGLVNGAFVCGFPVVPTPTPTPTPVL